MESPTFRSATSRDSPRLDLRAVLVVRLIVFVLSESMLVVVIALLDILAIRASALTFEVVVSGSALTIMRTASSSSLSLRLPILIMLSSILTLSAGIVLLPGERTIEAPSLMTIFFLPSLSSIINVSLMTSLITPTKLL